MASMFGDIGNDDISNDGIASTYTLGRHLYEDHIIHGTPTHFLDTELTILETALVYGFRHLADDDTRIKLLGILEQATAPLITKSRKTTG